jgi:hypothetical protein
VKPGTASQQAHAVLQITNHIVEKCHGCPHRRAGRENGFALPGKAL